MMLLQDAGLWALVILGLGALSFVTVVVTGVLHIFKRPVPALLAVAPMGLAALVVLGARTGAMTAIPYAVAHAPPDFRMSLVAAHVAECIGIHFAFSVAMVLPCVLAVLLSAVASLRSTTRGWGLPALAIVVALVAAITPAIAYLFGYSDLGTIGRGGLYLLLGLGCAVALLGKDPAARQAGLVAAISFATVVLAGEVYAVTADTTVAFSSIAAAPPEVKATFGQNALSMIHGAHRVAMPAFVAVMVLCVASLWRPMSSARGAAMASMSVSSAVACLAVALDPSSAFGWLLGTL